MSAKVGFYVSTDTRPFVTLDATKAAMATAGKFYEPVVYGGADHAFIGVGESPTPTRPTWPQSRPPSSGWKNSSKKI